jgi:hypothetical protein
MLRELVRDWFPNNASGFEQAGHFAATLVGLGFAVYVVVRIVLLWREERAESIPESDWQPWLRAAHDLTFVYLAFATLWWQPWYLVWLVGLAALLPSRTLHERALLFCYGATFNYVVFKYIWPVFQPMTYTTIMGISVLLIFGLPLLHLACTFRLPRWRVPTAGPAGA